MFGVFARESRLDFTSLSWENNNALSGDNPQIVMAEESGVTEAGLKAKITEQLQATHVEIEDMSGIYCPTIPLHCPRFGVDIC